MERLISIVKSDNLDYTKWRRNLWKDKTIDEIYNMTKKFEKRKDRNWREHIIVYGRTHMTGLYALRRLKRG
jgi:hypothetical protein